MAETEDALVGILAANSGVAGYVGANVFGVHWPQEPPSPAVLVQEISEVSGSHLRGVDGLALTRVQIDVLVLESSGEAKVTANAIAEAVNAALLSQPPFLAGGSPPTLRLAVLTQLDRRVQYAPNEFREVIVQQDYRVAVMPL